MPSHLRRRFPAFFFPPPPSSFRVNSFFFSKAKLYNTLLRVNDDANVCETRV